MCGIAGILFPDARPGGSPLAAKMGGALIHRGPDDSGVFERPGAALVSRRLSILDLSANGRMPMQTPDGRYTIVHNGEVYNYRDFQDGLKARGWKFRSHSDTEVLLYMYAEEGPAMLEKLNGMFAFAVWDEKEKKFFAARDRLGVKPFYYAVHGGVLYFASEERALFEAGVPKTFDQETLPELLLFRYAAGERTPFSGVKKLLPGHHLSWQAGKLSVGRWWSLASKISAGAPKNPEEWFRSVFDDAVRLRRISDVPVGVLLSGGLDSGSVAASLASGGAGNLQSFTIGFDEPGYDERSYARILASRFGFKNHERVIRGDELPALFDQVLRYQDAPPAHASDLHLLAIAQFAKPHVTVLLSGEGGDESMGGYQRYLPLRHPALCGLGGVFAPVLLLFRRPRLQKLRKFLEMRSMEKFVMFNSCEVFPQDLEMKEMPHFEYREKIAAEAVRAHPGDYVRQAMYYDHHTHLCSVLDRNDRMTMGASIECRTPFLDYRLIEGLAAMPSSVLLRGKPKSLLRNSVGGRLPAEILGHRKWGFGVPWGKYLRTAAPWREEVRGVSGAAFFRHAGIDKKISARVRDFENGDASADALIYQSFMLRKWHRRAFGS